MSSNWKDLQNSKFCLGAQVKMIRAEQLKWCQSLNVHWQCLRIVLSFPLGCRFTYSSICGNGTFQAHVVPSTRWSFFLASHPYLHVVLSLFV